MPFTAVQKTLTYEILGLFQGGTFDWYTYNDRITGEITSVPLANQVSFTVAAARLEVIFTAIEAAGDNREVRIGEILTEYSAISFDVTRIGPGGGGGAGGARYDPDVKRSHMKDLLERNLGIQIRQSGSPAGTFGRIGSGGGGGRSISVGR